MHSSVSPVVGLVTSPLMWAVPGIVRRPISALPEPPFSLSGVGSPVPPPPVPGSLPPLQLSSSTFRVLVVDAPQSSVVRWVMVYVPSELYVWVVYAPLPS